MSRLLWMIGQAAAVIGLTWIELAAPGARPGQLGLLVLINVVVVAFLTAVIVNLSDWLRRPRAVAGPGKIRQPQGQPLSPRAPDRFLSKTAQKGL